MSNKAGSNGSVPDQHRVQRPGLWLPEDHRVHQEWLERTLKHVDDNPKDLHPAVVELKDLIESDTRIYLMVAGMYDAVPKKHPYQKDPVGKRAVRDYHHMLAMMNHLLTQAPSWSEHSHQVGLVGLPMYALLDWPMGTTFGFAFFLDPQVNRVLKRILNVWGEFLASPASASCLSDSASGWFGPTAIKDLTSVANLNVTNHSFEDLFICDPKAKYHGFTSWDNFFTRQFHPEKRPIASPSDDSIIANVCESLPFRLTHNASRRAMFWLKGQPYSVLDILARDAYAERFVGGTIYQAFLSALSYHRWHSPISGKIVKTHIIDGSYYSEPLFEDFGVREGGADVVGQGTAQAYLTAVATRGLIFIEADNPDIGLVAVVEIGMSEVSTCDITVKEGQTVKKGDQLGMFHFGGSSHLVMFEKGVDVSGFPDAGQRKENVPVRSKLAVVGKRKA